MRYPVFVLDLVLLALITLAIVVSLRAIGNILVLAMLVTPAATARLLTNRLVVMQVTGRGARRGRGRGRALHLVLVGRCLGRRDRADVDGGVLRGVHRGRGAPPAAGRRPAPSGMMAR